MQRIFLIVTCLYIYAAMAIGGLTVGGFIPSQIGVHGAAVSLGLGFWASVVSVVATMVSPSGLPEVPREVRL